MFRRWWKNAPRWPESLSQSIENPVQHDRLPDTSGVELEYPAQKHTTAENRQYTVRLLSLALLIGLPFFLVQWLLTTVRLSPYLHAAGASVAIYVFLISYTTRRDRRPWWRWPLYFGVLPPILFLFILIADQFILLTLAFLFAAALADNFATHFFCLRTTVPMPRQQALELRELWKHRWLPFGRSPGGAELYLFLFVGIVVVYLVMAALHRRLPGHGLLHYTPVFVMGFLALGLVPLGVELVAAFLSARKRAGLGDQFRGFSKALVEWFTYNRHQANAPGTYRSPAGDCRARQRMTFAVVTLFASATAQFFCLPYWTPPPRGPIFPSQPIDTHIRPANSGWNDFSLNPHSPRPARAVNRDPVPHFAASGAGGALVLVSYSPDLADEAPDDLDLEPYQRAMLRRMTPEQRAAQIEKWRARKTPPPGPALENEDAHAQSEAASGLSEQDTPASTDALLRINIVATVFSLLVIAAYPLLVSLFPVLYFLGFAFATTAGLAGLYHRYAEGDDEQQPLDFRAWASFVTRVQDSEDETEQNSLFLGINAQDGTPVIVPRAVFEEHAHFLGDSGSGKTAIGLAGLIAQLLRFGDASVVVIDLKADDLALFEGVRREAEATEEAIKKDPNDPRNRYPFRWFTNKLHRSTYVFNPLTQGHFRNLTLYQRADILTAAMGLQYGSDYGRAYYGDANTELFYHALQQTPNLASFQELSEILQNKDKFRMDRKLRDDASHLLGIVNRLAACEPLNAHKKTKDLPPETLDHAIDFSDLFRTPQAVCFHLPSSIGTAGSAEIGRLVLYSLLSAAEAVGPDRKQVYLIIDEFQRMVAGNLELILQTARSMDIAVILANQSLANLKIAGIDLIPTVRANTRFRQVFAASDLTDQKELVASSGETLIYNRSWSEYLGLALGATAMTSMGSTETVTPRLRPNDILLATDHPQQSIVFIRRGHGYAQFGGMPFVMTSTYHISPEEYGERKRAPWPDHIPGVNVLPESESAMPSWRFHQVPSKEPLDDPVIRDDDSAGDTESAGSSDESDDDLWKRWKSKP